jgi:gas vesicle protein
MKVLKFLSGFAIGLVMGAVTVLLTAPQSGDDLQKQLRERADHVMEEGRRAAAERRAELEAQFAQSKQVQLNA